MKSYIYTFCLVLCLVSCSENQPRKPILNKSGTFMQESIERNKKLVGKEQDVIKKMIASDTANTYFNSEKGFWYAYQTKSSETYLPVKNDELSYNYSVKDINGALIYSNTEIGNKKYLVDRENIVTGLRYGLKLMHKGDVIKFVFPSNVAYGYRGDENKIGTNQPIVCTVSLVSIEKNKGNTVVVKDSLK
jgi:gliding motility-associated peptidyl-prolyl isomerase